ALPIVRDSDIQENDFSLPTEPRKSSGSELSNGIAFGNSSVQSALARPTERPLTLSVSTNSVPIAGTGGDTQWLGILERGNSSPAHSGEGELSDALKPTKVKGQFSPGGQMHSSTNLFVSRYAFAFPSNTLELEDMANYASAPPVPQFGATLTVTN